MEKNFFKDKRVIGVLAAIAFISGFLFTDKKLTGNVITDSSTNSGTIPLIGLGLLACAVVLTLYIVKQK